MNVLQAMRVFLRVSETGSFGRAAASLDISNAAVTRYVALLETHLTARLLNRTTRSVSLTEAGREYAQGCREVLARIDEIESSIGNAATTPSGTLRIVASTSFSLGGLTPMFSAYRAHYPDVRLHVTLLNRRVDLVEEGYDAGIVSPELVTTGSLVHRPLLTIHGTIVAAPHYLAMRERPDMPEALLEHAILGPTSTLRDNVWSFEGPHGTAKQVTLELDYASNDATMIRHAALAGMGIALVPESLVSADIESGALTRVLPAFRPTDACSEVSIVYPGRRHLSAKTRSFVEFAIEHFQQRDDRGMAYAA
ncbi:LysR family transcriptional regulator [Pararobbsia silviterrae]|uniref:LysR family transcriptional regulator n=1 Tax=Pararobbsia silviterrae TaxID=1792498 RepID=A0A494YEV2_9BURK|nr:LysR family transcriptional regulator [Pararobbsia silviterrae]RKP58893.1 LysR family transcriptional regulator [Pararobbsia silviterrae]